MPSQTQTVEITMADHGHGHALFDEAIENVQNTISAKDRSTFRHHADVSSLIEGLRSLADVPSKDQRRVVACSRKFTLFARSFSPYFDVLKDLDQVRPDWLGWFWGMLQLVFKAASKYAIFLEKVAQLLESIAHVLPVYRQIYQSCKAQYQSNNHDGRLVVLMSYVYADLMQFCLDVYRMFSRCSQGGKLRHLRLSSTPIIWRPLDSRFAQLEQRLWRHKKWFESETASQNHDHDQVSQNRREYVGFLAAQAEKIELGEGEEHRMARRLRRIDKVKNWLSNCCAYQDVYEHRIRERHPNTSSWFLNSTKYSKWKNAPFNETLANDTDELEQTWHDRVLFVQAKPGFGKTFISTSVIDDLSAKAEDLNISDDPPSTAYFHFNAAHIYCTHSNDAFRALAYQLVHAHRHDRPTLDALSLLIRKASNKEKASSDDVVAVLSLLLRQHSTFLVIDGVDECNDVETFLTLLPEVCRKSDTRAILFSRPSIEIPLEYQKWASDSPHIVSLSEEDNVADIEACVTESLNRMADQGFFGISMDRTLIQNVARKSDGTFLWASLLLKLLQSPVLSPNERRVALEQAQYLEGVEALYHNIFSILDQQPQNEKQTSADAFCWLSSSINRLCIPAFQTALATGPGKSIKESQDICEFTDSITRLTCGLIEVTDCSIIFSHSSVKEFLQSPKFVDSDFGLYDSSKVHARLATRCLTFLAHNIPKRPLQRLQPYIRPATTSPNAQSSGLSMRTSRSGDSGYKSMSSSSDTETPHMHPHAPPNAAAATTAPPFDAQLPFLRYAALCWPIHLSKALACTSASASTPHTPWLVPLSHFLTDRPALTAWVEASWRYSLPPNVSRLVPLLSELKAAVPPATVEGRELRWVVNGLRELGERLRELREWGVTVGGNPSLVWQWDQRLGMGEGERYWPVWDERAGAIRA
ncbi:hypothetical protein BS50DRAFT_490737 [Corynespora cassiicola Philippines]|uniref:NACHT domain-containing protein n=1 Tax=Corynespora cassiicola Philippines TaxID=1448308 RepID=A0A2T2NTJ1_CORCC|nr:hypothetical protein BS50DRAFT_490737 [Corynespora cassiicola Philippines]